MSLEWVSLPMAQNNKHKNIFKCLADHHLHHHYRPHHRHHYHCYPNGPGFRSLLRTLSSFWSLVGRRKLLVPRRPNICEGSQRPNIFETIIFLSLFHINQCWNINYHTKPNFNPQACQWCMIRKKVIGCWRRWCAKGTWFQITCWFGQSASELIVVSGTLCLQKALCGILLWNIFWGVTLLLRAMHWRN